MTTYTITEKQNVNSTRAGVEIEANSLSAAKRAASQQQMFQGTVLTIEQAGVLVATKAGGKWADHA